MKSNPVVWFEIYVSDMERASKFYETVLGVQLKPLTDPTDQSTQMLAFPDDPQRYGTGGTLVKMAGMEPGGSNVVIYFGCEDCAVEESRIVTAGGTVSQSKTALGEFGYCSIAIDSEGNTFGLHSMQ